MVIAVVALPLRQKDVYNPRKKNPVNQPKKCFSPLLSNIDIGKRLPLYFTNALSRQSHQQSKPGSIP